MFFYSAYCIFIHSIACLWFYRFTPLFY